jgi:tetratricopeptide (TPR) repeat protein
LDEQVRILDRALDVYEEIGDRAGVGWVHARLVVPLLMQARDDEAEAAGRAAIEILEPLGTSGELADALHRLGWYLWRRGRNEEAEPLLRRAVAMADHTDSPLVHAESTQTLAVCLSQSGRSAEAIVLIEEAYRLAKEVGEFSNLMRCYNNLPAVLCDLASDFRRSNEVLREGLELAQRAGARSHAGWITGSLGDEALDFGDLEEAEALQRDAMQLALEVGDEPLHGMRLTGLAAAILFRGRIDEAAAILREAIPILEANPEPQSQVHIPFIEGYLALARGAHGEVPGHLARGIEILRGINVESVPRAFTDVVRALVRVGRLSDAASYRDLSEHGRSPAARAHAALIEGLLADDPAEARRLLATGTEMLVGLGLRIDAARALVDLGRAMARVREDPRPTLERARAILLECDARAFLPEVDEALAELDR